MNQINPKVLIVATSRKTRGGITSVIKAHESGEQWLKYHCKWIETHRDGNSIRKLGYLFIALIEYIVLLPFYDIVHIHIATKQSALRKSLFIYPAKWCNKKIILHFHPSNEKFLFEKSNQKLYKRLFEKADLILVLSPQWGRWIEDSLGITENLKVLFNPSAVVNRREDLRKKNILFAGTLIERKGYEVLIKAFALINERFNDWQVVFAGNGEIEKAKKIAEEAGVTNNTVFLGWVNGKDKEQVFQEASIYCLASDGEGFPMGVLDAWAYGIPCVMTPVGGIPDIVEDGLNGMLFPVNDVVVLSEKLEKLIRNDLLRKSIVFETDKLIANEFNLQVINKKLELIYNSLTK